MNTLKLTFWVICFLFASWVEAIEPDDFLADLLLYSSYVSRCKWSLEFNDNMDANVCKSYLKMQKKIEKIVKENPGIVDKTRVEATMNHEDQRLINKAISDKKFIWAWERLQENES